MGDLERNHPICLGYWKAPTTKDNKFSPHNHNWTAEVLHPEKDA
jgi:hypothetical protein